MIEINEYMMMILIMDGQTNEYGDAEIAEQLYCQMMGWA